VQAQVEPPEGAHRAFARFMDLVKEADYDDPLIDKLVDDLEHLPYESTWSYLRFRVFGGEFPQLDRKSIAELLSLIATLEHDSG